MGWYRRRTHEHLVMWFRDRGKYEDMTVKQAKKILAASKILNELKKNSTVGGLRHGGTMLPEPGPLA